MFKLVLLMLTMQGETECLLPTAAILSSARW